MSHYFRAFRRNTVISSARADESNDSTKDSLTRRETQTHRHRATSEQTCANLEPSIFPELSPYWSTDFIPEDAINPDGMM